MFLGIYRVSVYNIDYIVPPIISPIAISSRYPENGYYGTIADQNSIICYRHFEQLDLNSLAWQKYEYPTTYIVYICALISKLDRSNSWNMTPMQEIVLLPNYFFLYDYGKTIWLMYSLFTEIIQVTLSVFIFTCFLLSW